MAVIEARNVSKRFLLHRQGASALKVRFLDRIHPSRRLPAEEFWALRDVSFDIDRGEAVGLVGRNGSGKSTLLKAIAGIHCPTSGHLRVPRAARIGTVIELGVGFHGELSGRENVFLNAAIHGLSRDESDAIYGPVVEYSGLAHFMDVPLKNYSSGMHTRLGFAVAAMLRPDILLLDEVFAVGDEDFQRRCMKTMEEFGARGTTVVFVSHAPEAVRAVCQRVCVLDGGRVVYDGSVGGGLEHYHALMQATEARRVDADRPAPRPSEATEAELDVAWHRRALGGRWAESGAWQYEFLREQGLVPSQYVLDLGCGSLAAARHLLPFMEPAHYWGFEIDRALFDAGVTIELARAGVPAERGHFIVNDRFDLGDCPYRFDVAIANSFFRRLSLNRIARCVAATMAKLKPGGRLFATWFDNPNPSDFRPMARPGRVVSYSDGEPFHYSYEMIARACELLGCRAERVEPRCPHPRGESVLVITGDGTGR
jgi:ABC-type polysaccharide/polyol phosphate transport system ATPase subunit/SAM-dependent methyltransferase